MQTYITTHLHFLARGHLARGAFESKGGIGGAADCAVRLLQVGRGERGEIPLHRVRFGVLKLKDELCQDTIEKGNQLRLIQAFHIYNVYNFRNYTDYPIRCVYTNTFFSQSRMRLKYGTP